MKNIKLILAYDGTHYHGWQRQSGSLTIQEVLEKHIQQMTGESISLIASGRTDAGVHALNQVCHFFTATDIPPDNIKRGLNSLLPDDIYIRHADYVPLDFHARYHAKSKTYEYRILNRKEPIPFLRLYTWHVPRQLDLGGMEQCMALLTGQHDFSSFRSSGSGNIDPVREILRAEISGPDRDILYFRLEGTGFLRHMVRNILGTVMEVGLGKMSPAQFEEIFHAKDRKRAGIKAPPQGLFLKMVAY